MAVVTLDKVVKRYGAIEAVRGIDLDIAHGEFVVLVGPSGCGKSTTLRMIAGLEEIDDGTIRIGDRVVNELAPRERNVTMVFQNYALYPHMTVRENLGFSLKIAKRPNDEIATRVKEAADILGLADLLDRTPAQLSGGQRQRVAMGRAIVRHPDVFLFDEPLSNLDAKLRVQMRTEIKRLHQRVDTTMVYVTHDQVEAMTLADRVVIMPDGRIEQEGAPLALFSEPANTFVAGFIGSPPMNLVEGTVVSDDGAPAVRLDDGMALPLSPEQAARLDGAEHVTVGLRAEDLLPAGHGVESGGPTMSFERAVNIAEPLGTESMLFLDFGGKEAVSKMFSPRPVASGEVLTFQINLGRLHFFDANSGAAV